MNIENLIQEIKNEKDFNKMIELTNKLNNIKNENYKNRVLFVLYDIIPKGYELKTFYNSNGNLTEIIFYKGFLKKHFLCIKNGDYSFNILKVINVKNKFSYQINGQSGKNTENIGTYYL